MTPAQKKAQYEAGLRATEARWGMTPNDLDTAYRSFRLSNLAGRIVNRLLANQNLSHGRTLVVARKNRLYRLAGM